VVELERVNFDAPEKKPQMNADERR